MQIVDERSSKTIRFSDLEVPSVFIVGNNKRFLRISGVFDDDANVLCNAVNLDSGYGTVFKPEDRVTPVDCKISLKDYFA